MLFCTNGLTKISRPFRCVTVRLMYDNLEANDCWIADTHTFDIQSYDENGNIHLLYLTAFLDAKSGVMTGWNITESPDSQSTILALRHGIMRFGVTKCIYVDNGREFLTHDIGGKGHRTHVKKTDSQSEPFASEGHSIQTGNVGNNNGNSDK
ncbi:MAG: transposase family protein [Ruminococcus sp.]|nr:transposase family protein [Ruminococcus sp.]